MVIRSTYIPNVDTREQAIAWINEVRPWSASFQTWIQTVVRYYNGCIPGVCGAYDARYANYRDKTTVLLGEMGPTFWYGAPASCGAIPPEGATLDDTDGCFAAGGNLAYWREVTSAGFESTLLWTNATASANASNYAVWTVRPSEAGRYALEVFTDGSFAESTLARYRVEHAGLVDDVVIDQTASSGFQSLGVFDFDVDEGQFVRLDDNTGEPSATMTALVADALRITRVPDAAPDGGVSDGGMEPDGSGSGDGGVPPPPDAKPRRDRGCSTGPGSTSAAPLALFAVAALARRRRR